MSRFGYESIAAEYYDTRHITSRSFDRSTKEFCKNYHFDIPQNGSILELGCGMGRSHEYCRIDSSRIVQTDISIEMLKLLPREKNTGLCCCDALLLPFDNNSFSGVTAFLFDPYNTLQLYREINRVLCPDGTFIGTLPHSAWGEALRPVMGYEQKKTVFYTKDGSTVEEPSLLMNDSQLLDSLLMAGLTPVKLVDLFLPEDNHPVSPFIEIPALQLGISPFQLPIVKLIMAKKEK